LRRLPAIAVVCTLAVAIAGCGEETGVSRGATVSVYVGASAGGAGEAGVPGACGGARRELERRGGAAGDVRVQVVCLDGGDGAARWRLAAVGDGARRAAEDSTTVAYLAGDPVVARFSRPIVEAAGIAQVAGASSEAAMARVLDAIDAAGEDEQLREAVAEALERGR
jgi:hypothetical protein